MNIEIIRHGETALQAERRYQGSTDAPLSPEGKNKLRPADPPFETVYVSPMLRARQTASILFPDARQFPVDDLREMDFGVFEGRSAKEMEDDAQYRAWIDSFCEAPCPGGESKAVFCDRVCRAFEALLDAHLAGPFADRDLCIVAHGGVAMAVMERFCSEQKPYYEWFLSSGCGYVLDPADWPVKKKLDLIKISDHTR